MRRLLLKKRVIPNKKMKKKIEDLLWMENGDLVLLIKNWAKKIEESKYY